MRKALEDKLKALEQHLENGGDKERALVMASELGLHIDELGKEMEAMSDTVYEILTMIKKQ